MEEIIEEETYSNEEMEEQTENLAVAETTEQHANIENEETTVTHPKMKETDVSVLLQSEIQNVIKNKISDQNRISELEHETSLANQLKDEYEKKIEDLCNVQNEIQRKLSEKIYRSSEIEMYISNSGTMINALKDYQDKIAIHNQQLLQNINNLRLTYSEKNSHLMKTIDSLNDQKRQHKEKMNMFISEKDKKYKQIYEEIEKAKEHTNSWQNCDNQLINEISQHEEKFNKNNLRNEKQKEQIDSETHALKFKQKHLESLCEEINHLEKLKKNNILQNEQNLKLLNKELNNTRAKLDGAQKEKNELTVNNNQQNNVISQNQVEYTSVQSAESELMKNKNDMELKLQQSKKDYSDVNQFLLGIRAAKSKSLKFTVSLLKLENEVGIKLFKADSLEKEVLTKKKALETFINVFEEIEKNIRQFTVKCDNEERTWIEEIESVKWEHQKLQEDKVKLLERIEHTQQELAIKVAKYQSNESKKKSIIEDIEQLKQQLKETFDPIKENYEIKLQLRGKLEGEKQRLMQELKELENTPFARVPCAPLKNTFGKPIGILKTSNTPTKHVTFRQKLFSETSIDTSLDIPEKQNATKPSELTQKETSTSKLINSLLQKSSFKQRGTKRMSRLDSPDIDE